ncbi:hypothetical protein B5X24_HaOG213576 [Helicoverpa armigera]|uniref:Uncharacterized protein n=1 Tax=Helicoverpa armigera TaxID=29058 RepID=A0A2W1BDF4_HELAM|nr:hypothetical protein B5X24_HaOG213576 [Helicoverpa armigera]
MEPPDDPGGTLPPEVGHYVTVSNNDTGVDTDGSALLPYKRHGLNQGLCLRSLATPVLGKTVLMGMAV